MKSQNAVGHAVEIPPLHNVTPQASKYNSWEDVSDLCKSIGLTLDPWQELILQSAMGERSDGTWAAKRVGISVARQNGKSLLSVARALAGALLFGEKKIIISAHQQDTARETFQKFLELRDGSPQLAEYMPEKLTMNAINRETIKFTNGATIQFKARSAPGGRGFSADCLLLDEAQILSRRAWASINSTMSARENPQVWLLGTPPTPEDDSEVFASVRSAALEHRSGQAAWIEWAAEPDDDPALTATRVKANPAWYTRINHEVVQGEYETYSTHQFATERLGIWDVGRIRSGVIPMDAWKDRADPSSKGVGDVMLGVEVGPDLAWASVSLAGRRSDGGWHIELVENRNGAAWLPAYLGELLKLNPDIKGIVCDVGGPIKAMLEQRGARYVLPGVHLQLTPMRVVDLAIACSQALVGTVTGWLHHTDQPQLTAAAQAAGKRMIGDSGTWVFSRKSATSDITPIQSATYALWGAQNPNKVYRPRLGTGAGRTSSGRRATVS